MSNDVQRCPTMSNDVQRCPTVSNGVQRCPTMSNGVQRCPTSSNGVQRCPTVQSSLDYPKFSSWLFVIQNGLYYRDSELGIELLCNVCTYQCSRFLKINQLINLRKQLHRSVQTLYNNSQPYWQHSVSMIHMSNLEPQKGNESTDTVYTI